MKRKLDIFFFLILLPVLVAQTVRLAAQAFDWTAIPGAKLCIEIREPGFHTNLFYTPAEVAAWKTPAQAVAAVNAEKVKRMTEHADFVTAQSKIIPKESTAAELIEQQAEMQKRMDSLLISLAKSGSKAEMQKVVDALKASTETLDAAIAKVK